MLNWQFYRIELLEFSLRICWRTLGAWRLHVVFTGEKTPRHGRLHGDFSQRWVLQSRFKDRSGQPTKWVFNRSESWVESLMRLPRVLNFFLLFPFKKLIYLLTVVALCLPRRKKKICSLVSHNRLIINLNMIWWRILKSFPGVFKIPNVFLKFTRR